MSGVKERICNLNDLQKNYPLPHRKDFADEYGYDQIGTKETIEAMMRIARENGMFCIQTNGCNTATSHVRAVSIRLTTTRIITEKPLI